MKQMKIFVYIFFFIIIISLSFAQNALEQRLRLAETYEKSGDFKNASRIFEELYKENPNNAKVFEGLVRNFVAQNRYSELLQFVKDRYANQKDIFTSTIYGELLWRTGSTSEANKVWDKAISDFAQNPLVYEQISNTMIQLRLFDKAIAVLNHGRKNLNNKTIFTDNLSKLYIAIGDYKNGLDEILSFLQINWNLALAQGRIYALNSSNEAENYIFNELKKFAINNKDNIVAQELFAWFLRTTNKLDQALELYKNIDRLKKANGAEIIRFGEDSRRDGQYEIALKAFETVIDFGKNNPYIHSALFGYARTLEQKILNNKQISKADATEIVKRYKSIINDFPNTQQATESRLRIAFLYANYLNNSDEAIKELNLAISERPGTSIAASASIDLANIYINLEKFNEAENILQNTIRKFSGNFQSYSNKSSFLLAEILYFKGLLDSALKQYSNLIIVPETDIANAALNRIVLLEQNQQFTKALVTFARAEFEERRNNVNNAKNYYDESAKLSIGSELFELAMRKKVQLEFENDEFSEVISSVNFVFEKAPETLHGDFFLLRKADALVKTNNKKDALNLYTEILSKYPLSIYLPEIREKIRTLRNELL